ncbi:sensor histidine kinase [Nocardia stercoris]|uniref:sensor histidine kinase n=1 Tax=Nocardia stercoris TaxID=2483361 RepID=UPI001F452E2E|nr:nitrate- and nitrite sensing domain-containing protein [Nocardia stercoris]
MPIRATRWRARTVRGRLARILALSVVLVLALLAVIVSGEIGRYRDASNTVGAVALALETADLVHELQSERGLTNGLLSGRPALRPNVNAQRGAVDHAANLLDTALGGAEVPGAEQVRAAAGRLSTLGSLRILVDGGRAPQDQVFGDYTSMIDALNRVRPGQDSTSDPSLQHGLRALFALGDAKEATAQERGFLNGIFGRGALTPGEYTEFLAIRAHRLAALDTFGLEATPRQRDAMNRVLGTENATRAGEAEQLVTDSAAGRLDHEVDPAAWWAEMTALVDDQRALQQQVGTEIRTRARDLLQRAELQLAGYLAVALLALGGELALVLVTARSIARPLALLAGEAEDVAAQRLPAVIAAWAAADDTEPDPPAPVRTPAGATVEIESVARALDRVQHTAFELASQQARLRRNTVESLANLGRRNQNLVRRQLSLISEFEQDELDPRALSRMFDLDHLATRMRRNAESLLVLVGEKSPRRWSEPVLVTDVVRAALSEVDDYRRVALRRVDDVPVTGAVVGELAHLLAELIENGLAFSPPDLEVEIFGRRVGAQYLLAVVDHGVGLSPDQLATANARLRGTTDFLVVPTRFLGHYVVGRLARRLGIQVELAGSPLSGVVARVLLPAELLADPAAVVPKSLAAAPRAAISRAPEPAPAPTNSVVVENVPASEPIASAELPSFPRDPFPTLPAGRTRDLLRPRAIGARSGTVPVQGGTATAVLGPAAQAVSELSVSASGGAPAHRTEPERTRNGLVKRARKPRDPVAAVAAGPARAPAPSRPDRSPEQVGGMLSSFRSGHQRGIDSDSVSPTTPQEDIR